MSAGGASASDRLKFMYERCGATEEERFDNVDQYVNTDDAFGKSLKKHKISWPSNWDSFQGVGENAPFFDTLSEEQSAVLLKAL